MNQLQHHQGHTLSVQGLHGILLAQTVPTSLAAGSVYEPGQVHLTFKNDGIVPWPAGAVRLETRGFEWDAAPLVLGQSAGPNGQAAFGLTVHAPDTLGDFTFSWQLVTDTGRELLDTPTPALTIHVLPSCQEFAAENRADSAELRQLRLEVTRLQAELGDSGRGESKAELRAEIAAAKQRIVELKAGLEERKQTMHELGCG